MQRRGFLLHPTSLRRTPILSPSPPFWPPKSGRQVAVTREIVCGDKRFTQVRSIPGLMGGSAYKGSVRYKWPGGLVLSRCALMEQGLLPAASCLAIPGRGRRPTSPRRQWPRSATWQQEVRIRLYGAQLYVAPRLHGVSVLVPVGAPCGSANATRSATASAPVAKSC